MNLPSRLAASRASERQLQARIALTAPAIITTGVPFFVILGLVQSRAVAVTVLDTHARDGLNGYALAHPWFVTVMEAVSNSGSSLAWQIVVVVLAAALLWRRQVRLALFVVVTNIGSSLINGVVKTMTNRPRPVVDHPFLHEPGLSFPSGHAQTAVVGYGVLMIVILPLLHRHTRWQRRGPAALASLAAVMILAIGFSRVALAVHYVTDVLAGYLLGLAWLVTMAAAFDTPWPHRTKGSTSASPRPDAHPRAPISETASPAAALPTPPIDRASPAREPAAPSRRPDPLRRQLLRPRHPRPAWSAPRLRQVRGSPVRIATATALVAARHPCSRDLATTGWPLWRCSSASP